MLLDGLRDQNATLIGGEWLIRFDHDFQTEHFSAADVKETTFKPAWPPVQTDNLRLGSGSGERGTYGPATLWDLEKVDRWYPTYFGNREPILSIGDAIFWQCLKQGGHKLARLPQVIGRYYSSPDAQAEFRPHNDNENLRNHGPHKVSFAHQITASQGATPAAPSTAGPVLPAPRNPVETKSRALAIKYLAMFGHTPQAQQSS